MTKYTASLGLRAIYDPAVTWRYGRPRAWGRFLILAFFAIFGGLYLLAVNDTAIKGYRIRELEQYIEEIRLQNQKIELELTSRRSMPYLESRLAGQPFLPVASLKYIEAAAPAVALK